MASFQCSGTTIHIQRRRYPQPFSFRPLSTHLAKSRAVRFPVIRASSSSSEPKPSVFKTTFITLTAAAALFSASFYLVSSPPAVTPVAVSAEEATPEKKAKSNDVRALLSLTKIKFESNEHSEAVEILKRVAETDPDELEWPLMRARILAYNLDRESATKAYEEILVKDPIRVEAYHHLVIMSFASTPKLTELEKRITDAIGRCDKEKEVRDFRLLVAQIRVFQGNPLQALEICEDLLVKDDPDNRTIYLFQGFVYLLMRQDDEAAKQFKHFTSLLPEDHPFLQNTSTTQVSDWRLIVAYDSIFSYVFSFAPLLIGSLFSSIKRIIPFV